MSQKPTSVTYSSVFVIDLSSVWCIDDLRADDNGVWIRGGKPRRKYIVDFYQSTSEVINATPVSGDSILEESSHFTLVHTSLPSSSGVVPSFQRRISYVIDSKGQTVQYAVVQNICLKMVMKFL